MINNICPNDFKDVHKDKTFLLIGCGHSASEIIPFKKELHNFFDIIIGLNKAFVEFDNVMDYHLVSEKITKANAHIFSNLLNDGDFDTHKIRFINFKGLSFFNTDKYNIVPITRSNHNNNLDFKSYITNSESHVNKGFYSGPVGSDGFSLGTVMLQGIHLASIMGAKNIYMIGVDLVFKNNSDHFYGGRTYRDKKIGKKENQHKIVKCGEYETTRYYLESAKFLDTVIEDKYNDIGVFDFSNGLIRKAEKINVMEFFKSK